VSDHILVVDDDPGLRELLADYLGRNGFRVTGVADGRGLWAALEQGPVDLVILDLMLPGLDGLTVCRKLRANPKTAGLAIVMVTAKGEEGDIVTGLNMGANDYITKPFSRNVLLARMRAVLRNVGLHGESEEQDEADAEVRIHNLVIHPGRHQVLVDGQAVELSATEFRLLYVLARKPGWVFTRDRILDAVHGDNYVITERAVDVHIVSLRRKLGTAGQYIETVRGVGYRFKE
jgi:two-component system phosphate regulon response regulator PhoB